MKTLSDNTHQSYKTDYLPWVASEEEKAEQKLWIKELESSGDIQIGEDSYVSKKAAFYPSHFRCGGQCFIAAESMIRGTIEMGDQCSVNAYTVLAGNLRIGNMVRIASHVSIFGFNHGHEDPNRTIFGQPHTSEGIVIEDDVWIGAQVVIVDGVTIGAHTVLAAGAVVTKDVPPYSIMGGNPARRLRDRRKPKQASSAKRETSLKAFGEMAREQHTAVLDEAMDFENDCYVDNQKNRKPTSRAWCDAVEIAGFFDAVPPHADRDSLIEKLQSFQNPETGCFDAGLTLENPTPIERVQADGYSYLCVGYALEVLGSHLAHKNKFLEQVTSDALYAREAELPWAKSAWGGGSWNDHLGTAAYHDLAYHNGSYDLSALFGWLNLHCNPASGLWGEPTRKQKWLQPVNGFYRLTRGTYAQFGQPLPYPVDAIDTILTHCRQYRNFLTDHVTACNVLDIVHPLWLCAKETDHRQDEIRALMEAQVDAILTRWIPQRGFAFSSGHEPGLQGTEMWLSILYIAADYLGLSDTLGYHPKGVHRTEVALQI